MERDLVYLIFTEQETKAQRREGTYPRSAFLADPRWEAGLLTHSACMISLALKLKSGPGNSWDAQTRRELAPKK